MKNTLKKLLILSGLVICATSSFASPVNATNNIDDPTHQKVGAIFLNDDGFGIEYKNNTSQNFYYDNDQGHKDAVIDNANYFYEGHGYVLPHGANYFSTLLSTSLTSKGAKRQVFLYLPITSGADKGKYKKISFMIWTPHSGNPSWKLGTCNMSDPMEEDDYCNYYYPFADYIASSRGMMSQKLSWGVVRVEMNQDNGGDPYFVVSVLNDSSEVEYHARNPSEIHNETQWRMVNSQTINTNWVRGDIVNRDQLPGFPNQAFGNAPSNSIAASIPAPKGTYDFGQWKADEYPVVYSPKEIHPFVTYNGKGYVACNGDTTAKDVPGKSDAWKEVNGSLGNTCDTVHSYKKQSTTPSIAKSAVSFW